MEPFTDQVSGNCKYINRDLSWLEFNRQVLEEAKNEHTPPLERAKFLAIVPTNLDEFMSVRVAGIRNQIVSGIALKPVHISENNPFPLISSNSLYFSIVLKPANESIHDELTMAILEVPTQLGRFIEATLPNNRVNRVFILLEELINAYIHLLFHEHIVVESHLFRIIRDADLSLEEGNVEDLLHEVERKLRRRLRGAAIRLEIGKEVHPFALKQLSRQLDVGDNVARLDGPVTNYFFH